MKTLFEETTEKLDEIYKGIVDPDNKDQVLKIIEALEPIFEYNLPEKKKTEKQRKERVRGVVGFIIGEDRYIGTTNWKLPFETLMLDKFSHVPYNILKSYFGDYVVNDFKQFADSIQNPRKNEKKHFILNKEKNIYMSICYRDYLYIERLENLCRDILGKDLELVKKNP